MALAAPFTISRLFNAPRDLLFRVHTDPAHLAQWLSPEGFKNIYVSMDFQVGGIYHYGLENAEGMQLWGRQVFREIIPNEKIVLIQSFSNRAGGLARHPLAATWPLELLASTQFEDAGPGKTKLTISWLPHNADDIGNATFDHARDGMTQGFSGTFEQLDDYLKALQD